MRLVYLDHAALTPMPSMVMEEMSRAAAACWGHPSAVHAVGRRARARLEEARDQVAALIGCPPGQIEWYGSGTRALIEAIRTTTMVAPGPVVCARIEHPSVLDDVAALAAQHRPVHWLDAPAGDPRPVAAEAFGGDGIAIFAPLNHEMGTAPAAWAAAPPASAAWSIVDAVQAAAWMDLRPYLTERSWIIVASHKLGGPPGAAALRVPPAVDRRRHPPAADGGVPWLAAIGMGAACELRAAALPTAALTVRHRATELLRAMQAAVPSLRRIGGDSWLGPILSLSVPGVPGRALEAALDLRGVCVSRTAACRQGSSELGDRVETEDPNGHRSSTIYDGFGDCIGQTEGNGALTRFVHDQWGQIIEETNPFGHTRRYQYNRYLQRVATSDAEERTWRFELSPEGNHLVRHDATGRWEYHYNSCGKVTEIVDPQGLRTSYVWDTEPGQLLEVRSPSGNGRASRAALGATLHQPKERRRRSSSASGTTRRAGSTTTSIVITIPISAVTSAPIRSAYAAASTNTSASPARSSASIRWAWPPRAIPARSCWRPKGRIRRRIHRRRGERRIPPRRADPTGSARKTIRGAIRFR